MRFEDQTIFAAVARGDIDIKDVAAHCEVGHHDEVRACYDPATHVIPLPNGGALFVCTRHEAAS